MTIKYEFTGETKTLPNGIVVRQIRRVADGAIGGWIETEANLSREGDGWIGPNGIACRGGTIWGGTIWGPFDFLVVQGLPYQATIQNDGRMSIGCKVKTFADWRAVTFENLHEIGSEAER